jgi:hypothetical protein
MNKDFEKIKLDILKRKNVVMVGQGADAIEVSVIKKLPEKDLARRDMVPKMVAGQITNVTQTGEIKALGHVGRFRPAPGGVSAGHFDITAGTLGMWIQKNDLWFILSNNHILANSNDANLGDAILQPAPMDGGSVKNDTIARLSAFIPINFRSSGNGGGICPFASATAKFLNTGARLINSRYRMRVEKVLIEADELNLVDAALAEVINSADIQHEILGIGQVAGTEEARLNMSVKKTGRTTEHTNGIITQLEASVNVGYSNGRSANFTNQIVTEAMSQGGDSGSILVTKDGNKAVGLLYAGSDNRTIYNRIQNVEEALQIAI